MQQLSWCLAVASREDTERLAWTEMGDSWFGWVGQMPPKKMHLLRMETVTALKAESWILSSDLHSGLFGASSSEPRSGGRMCE